MLFKIKTLQSLALFLLTLLPGFSRAETLPDSTVPSGYSLVWSDEFNQAQGGGVDPSVWNYEKGRNPSNNEMEIYGNDPKNISIKIDPKGAKSYLAITATKNDNGDYLSARINTRNHKAFQYGYVEARIQIPYGQGIWPAFWMLGANNQGWPHCGEIDIMENIGKFEDQGTCHGSLHGPGYSGGHCLGGQYVLPNGDRFKNGYHIFAVLWEKDSVQFYCDGHLYETRTPRDLPAGNEGWVYNHPFFLILNFAVGGNWPGNPDNFTVFPQTMKVDYVRVYQKLPATPTSTPFPSSTSKP